MGDTKAETESEKVAEQYLALQTMHHTIKILKRGTDGKSRLFQKYDETITLHQRAQYL
jgi:hypothetical protein